MCKRRVIRFLLLKRGANLRGQAPLFSPKAVDTPFATALWQSEWHGGNEVQFRSHGSFRIAAFSQVPFDKLSSREYK